MEYNDFESWKETIFNYFMRLNDAQQIEVVSSLIEKGKVGLKVKWHLSQSLDKLLKRDFIGNLPTELSHYILDYLDDESLLSCCLVNKTWYNIISSCRRIWWKFCKTVGALHDRSMSGKECMQAFLHAKGIVKLLAEGNAWNKQKVAGHPEKVIALAVKNGVLATGIYFCLVFVKIIYIY